MRSSTFCDCVNSVDSHLACESLTLPGSASVSPHHLFPVFYFCSCLFLFGTVQHLFLLTCVSFQTTFQIYTMHLQPLPALQSRYGFHRVLHPSCSCFTWRTQTEVFSNPWLYDSMIVWFYDTCCVCGVRQQPKLCWSRNVWLLLLLLRSQGQLPLTVGNDIVVTGFVLNKSIMSVNLWVFPCTYR